MGKWTIQAKHPNLHWNHQSTALKKPLCKDHVLYKLKNILHHNLSPPSTVICDSSYPERGGRGVFPAYFTEVFLHFKCFLSVSNILMLLGTRFFINILKNNCKLHILHPYLKLKNMNNIFFWHREIALCSFLWIRN